jgi:hypothetical protein
MMASRQKTSCNAARTPAINTSLQARHPLSNGLLAQSRHGLTLLAYAARQNSSRLCENSDAAQLRRNIRTIVRVQTKHCCVFHFINASFLLCGGVAASFHTVYKTYVPRACKERAFVGCLTSYCHSRIDGQCDVS